MNPLEERLHPLMRDALSGDESAYRDLLRALGLYLRSFFRRRTTRFPDELEDLVQETLIAVHNQRHTYDITQPFTAWIHAIARFKLIDLLRRRGVREALNDPLDEEHELGSSINEDANDARRDVSALLATLPDKQRVPIELVKIEGITVAETARRTGLSESAVKIGIHRGLKALAARLRNNP